MWHIFKSISKIGMVLEVLREGSLVFVRMSSQNLTPLQREREGIVCIVIDAVLLSLATTHTNT